jgi:hypothetical protein
LPRLRSLWQRLFERAPTPVRYDWFLPAEVARYDTALAQGQATRLDDATWADLELGRYLDLLAAPCSIFGRQMLYRRLRAGGCPLRGTLDEAALQSASHATAVLHQADTEVAGLLFEDSMPQLPTWTRWLGPLAWALPAAIALWAVTGAALGGVAVVAALVLSARAQIALHGPMVLWHRQRRTLLALLDAAQALNAQQHLPWQAEADALRGDVQRLRTALGPGWVEQVPALADYANLLALYQYRRLSRELTQLRHELPVLQQVYQHVAGAEADLAVQQHLRATAPTCVAEPAGPRELDLQDVVHPLVQPAHALSLRLDGQGALITGRNGAGKSTLLRTVGLNVVVARAFGFCYARRARVPAVTVVASLQVEDSLRTATSLYMAELDRARALSQAAQQTTPVLVLIDEIFRGTNHLESVAATAALAHELAGRALLLLATHHVVLAPLLGGELQPLCVSRDPQGAQQLTPGVLEEPNGLAMLADYGFAPATQATAAQVLAWLQGYMAHPSTFPRLGGTPTAP